MKNIPDKTGRFRLRPHWPPEELDQECEAIITHFMREVCGDFTLPIPTDVLTKLIERDAEYLDLYADLSKEEGMNVEGVTDFCSGAKPVVRVASRLSEATNQSHRLRTTLTHEYGHVKFHNYLYQEEERMGSLFPDAFVKKSASCKRATILDAPAVDWMEWQAGYVCGSLLMPLTYIKRLVGEYRKKYDLLGPVSEYSKEGLVLLATVSETFNVSEEAARIRLLKLNYVTSSRTHTDRLY